MDNMDSFTLSTKSITKNRFSEFPDELLDQIFSYLPPKDIVRTSALSKRWRSLWTSFNFISFDFDPWNEEEEQAARFLDLIQRELLIPDNEYIRIFRLHLDINGPFYTYSNIMVSMSLVSKIAKHQIEDLDLSFRHIWRSNALSLITCLKLHMTPNAAPINNIPTSIRFPRLKALYLICAKFQNEHSAQLLFSACPVLKELLVDKCSWNKINGVTISIFTLHTLTIYHHKASNYFIKLRFCSNLQFFKLWSDSLFEIDICNLHCPHAHIEIVPWGPLYKQVQLAHCTLKFLESLCRSVKFLTLSHGTLQAISCAENFDAGHVPSFSALNHLKVGEGDCDFSAAALLHIVEKAANLQSLDFPDGLKLRILKEEEIHFLKNVVPHCLKYRLKTFRLSGFRGSAEEVHFLEYILKNANGLEQFSVLKGKRG